MIFLVVASTLLVTVFGQARDPTKVCLPDVLQIQTYSLKYSLSAVLAYDFTKNMAASRIDNGLRQVYDYAAKISALINETDGTCTKYVADNTTLLGDPQCLPPNATLLTDEPKFFGLNPGGLEIEAWQLYLSKEVTLKAGFTKSSPAIPVIRQVISTGILGKELSDVEIMFNPKTSIDDPTIFTIPPVCPTLS